MLTFSGYVLYWCVCVQAFGEFEDRSISVLIAAAKAAGVRPMEFVAKGGETNLQLLARARQFFAKLIRYT